MKAHFNFWLIVLTLAWAGLVTLLRLTVPPAHAAGPWYVGPGGSDANTCLSPAARCATINGALNKPGFVASDTIRVAIGAYTGTGNEVVLLGKNATLSGGWNSNFTTQTGMSTIDGQGARRGVTIDGATVIVEHFTIQNGSSTQGGGIYSGDGILTLNNSIVSSNSGGGIYGWIGSNLILNNSTVSDNAASSGGGIVSVQGLILNNSTVSSNTASVGGGILLDGPGRAILNNSTVSYNTALFDGGGIYNNSVSDSTSFTLRDTIVAANVAVNPGNGGLHTPDCRGVINSIGYNLIGNTSGCMFTPTIGDLTKVDPKLGPLEGSPAYYPLLFGSPAINAGNPTGCTDNMDNPLPTDQRGAPRVGRCDIGAIEAQELETSIKVVNASIATPGTPLTYTISLRNISVANVSNILVTDTLPIPLAYINNSLTATGGSYSYSSGVISWTGTMSANSVVTIAFGATVSPTAPFGISILNSAVISGGGEIITRTATLDITPQVYLPVVLKN